MYSIASDVTSAYSWEQRAELQDIFWHDSKQRYHFPIQLTKIESSKCANPSTHVLHVLVPQM